MKTIFILIAIAIIFYSCSSPKSKAESNIKNYLVKNLSDPQSYEAVEFGKLDSVFADVITNPVDDTGKMLLDSLDRRSEITMSDQRNLVSSRERIKNSKIADNKIDQSAVDDSVKLTDNLKKDSMIDIDLIARAKAHAKKIKGQFIGYSMMHKFKAKSGTGALTLTTETFDLDTDYKVVNGGQ